jgi:acyl-CoA dehydrogenase
VELVDGVLRGTLVLVDHADASDRLIVVARVEGMRALAVVDMNSPRVKVARMDSFDPVIRPCQVTLASAEPISSPVTGQVARMLIEDISIYGLLTTTAQLSGIMDEVLRMSVQYAKDRIQFGRPIGAFQSIQHRLADMAVLCAAGESSCDAAVAIASAGRSDKAVGLGGLKGAVSSYARAVVESGLQVHGGIGFTDEHVLHLYFKHALRMQAAWGSDADHAIAVARRILAAT